MKFDEKDFQEKLALAIEGFAHDLRREFKLAAPKDTGFLYRNIEYKIVDGTIEFSFPFYALFLEYGTGIYGPLKRPIRPKTKKALAWGKTLGYTKDGKEIKQFIAKEVKGMTARPFIRPVLHQKFKELLIKNLNMHMKNIKIHL